MLNSMTLIMDRVMKRSTFFNMVWAEGSAHICRTFTEYPSILGRHTSSPSFENCKKKMQSSQLGKLSHSGTSENGRGRIWNGVLFAAAPLCLTHVCPESVGKHVSFSPCISSGKQRHLLSPPCLKFELEMMSWDRWIKSAQVYARLASIMNVLLVQRNSESFPAGKPTPLRASVRRQDPIPARPEPLLPCSHPILLLRTPHSVPRSPAAHLCLRSRSIGTPSSTPPHSSAPGSWSLNLDHRNDF